MDQHPPHLPAAITLLHQQLSLYIHSPSSHIAILCIEFWHEYLLIVEHHVKCINILNGQKAEFLMLKQMAQVVTSVLRRIKL